MFNSSSNISQSNSKDSNFSQIQFQKKPHSNLLKMKQKKIQKKTQKNEYQIGKSSQTILDKLTIQQNNINSNFIKEKQHQEYIVELPPDDELDFAYNDTQYKFKVCGNKYIPRYMDSSCLGIKLEELTQLLNDSIHGFKVQETCKIQELEIDYDSYEQCQVCNVESAKLNNIIRRKNYKNLPQKLIDGLKIDSETGDYMCLFYKCKEKNCELLLCPYCYVYGIINKAEKKSDREVLFDAIRGKSNNKQFQKIQ